MWIIIIYYVRFWSERIWQGLHSTIKVLNILHTWAEIYQMVLLTLAGRLCLDSNRVDWISFADGWYEQLLQSSPTIVVWQHWQDILLHEFLFLHIWNLHNSAFCVFMQTLIILNAKWLWMQIWMNMRVAHYADKNVFLFVKCFNMQRNAFVF